MNTLYLNVADAIIRVDFQHSDYGSERVKFIQVIKRFCRGFLTDPQTSQDYTVRFREAPKQISFFNQADNNGFMLYYRKARGRLYETYYYISVFQFQTLIHVILMDHLERGNGFLIHASASRVEGGAVLFLGDSGAGKSTIMKLLNPTYPSLASDSIIVKRRGHEYRVFQTPFIEKDMWVKKKKGSFPIRAIFFLRKSTDCRTEPVNDVHKLLGIMSRQVFVNKRSSQKTSQLLLRFVNSVPQIHMLYFPKDASVIIPLLKKFKS